MLKARAAAGGAAAIATVEAELAGRVTALFGERRVRKNLADGIPRAHIAGRVRASRLANGRLVHKHHVAQLLGAQQAVMLAGRLGGFAKVAQERRCQNILDQSRLAGPAHPGDTHQPLQRKLHRDVFQVVVCRTFQNQARRARLHQPPEPHAHFSAPAQIRARECVGVAQVLGAAVKHYSAAALARAGAHVDHAVGGQHHGRVMLHHHQRVASIAQALHGHNDAVHVARVQANAGLVEHKQGIDQRGAQGGGQVDALHFAAAQGTALAVQRQVTNADIAQVPEPCGDLVEQQLERLVLALGHGRRIKPARTHASPRPNTVKKLPHTVQRQHHQVM